MQMLPIHAKIMRTHVRPGDARPQVKCSVIGRTTLILSPLSSLRFDGLDAAFICRSGRLQVTSTSHTQPAAMYLTRSEYDRGVNTFSPEGRLFQVEYAIEAIKLGSTAVGLQTKSGCVLAVEKRLTSTLLDPASVEKIAEIDTHIGAAMSGLVADARTLVDHARVEAQNHTFTYDEPIGVEALTQGEYMYRVDEEWMTMRGCEITETCKTFS